MVLQESGHWKGVGEIAGGLLNFACKVIPQGRCFLRRMFDTLSIANKKHHFIRLNVGFRSDLAWWSTFCERWNGVGFLHLAHMVVPSITFSSDASGTWGCGALWQSQWIQGSLQPKNHQGNVVYSGNH